MKILLVNNTPLPALKYGGTERIIWWLGKELVKQGHHISYLVAPNSKCPFAPVFPYSPKKTIRENLHNVKSPYDLIHFHFPLPLEQTHSLNAPHLFTLHGIAKPNERISQQTVFLSKKHAALFNGKTFIYNGIDPLDYENVPIHQTRKGFSFLAHASRPEKNLVGAIRIAQTAKETLEIMGGRRLNFNRNLHYHGMVAETKKKKLLSHSKALIFPVLWQEPFGLALLEALLCGTPIIGTPRGALPEIVSPEVGFLSNNEKELCSIAQKLHLEKTPTRFPPATCKKYVINNFSSAKMASQYLTVYEKIIANEKLHPAPLTLQKITP